LARMGRRKRRSRLHRALGSGRGVRLAVAAEGRAADPGLGAPAGQDRLHVAARVPEQEAAWAEADLEADEAPAQEAGYVVETQAALEEVEAQGPAQPAVGASAWDAGLQSSARHRRSPSHRT
jgi:hypothetical protein